MTKLVWATHPDTPNKTMKARSRVLHQARPEGDRKFPYPATYCGMLVVKVAGYQDGGRRECIPCENIRKNEERAKETPQATEPKVDWKAASDAAHEQLEKANAELAKLQAISDARGKLIQIREDELGRIEKELTEARDKYNARPTIEVEKEVLPMWVSIALSVALAGWIIAVAFVSLIDIPDVRPYKVPVSHPVIVYEMKISPNQMDLLHQMSRLRRRLHECVSQ